MLVEVDEPHPHGADLRATEAALRPFLRPSKARPWIVIDGYHFDTAYQRHLRGAGYRLVVIDDTNHLPFYDADIVLNHGAHAPRLVYPCARETALLLGTCYALLRMEFLRHRGKRKMISEVARKILVTFGGSDPVNATAKAMKGLREIGDQRLHVKVIVGPVNPHGEGLRAIAAGSRCPMTLETGAERIASLMDWADLAVTAAGGTCWELAAVGVPMVHVVVASNQTAIAAALAEETGTVNLGWYENVSMEQLARTVDALSHDPDRRAVMSLKGQALVDGHGASRVVDAIIERSFAEASSLCV